MMAVRIRTINIRLYRRKREREMTNKEFMKLMFDNIRAYSTTNNVFADVLNFLTKIVHLDEDEGFIVDVSSTLMKSGNADIIGEADWSRLVSEMASA